MGGAGGRAVLGAADLPRAAADGRPEPRYPVGGEEDAAAARPEDGDNTAVRVPPGCEQRLPGYGF